MATPDGGIPRRNPPATEAQWLARILEVVPGGIVQLGADGAILRANEQARRFLGLAWDELGQRFIVDFAGETFHEDGSACLVEDYPAAQCLATGQMAGPSTIGVRQPSGEVRWAIFTALPLPDASSGELGAVVTFVDITDRRRAEMRARAHDRVLETVRMVHLRDDPGAAITVFHEPLGSLCELTGSERAFAASVEPGDEPPEELRMHARVEPAGTGSLSPVPIDALTREVLSSGLARVAIDPGPVGALRGHAPRAFALLPLVRAGRVAGIVGLADAPAGYDMARIAELEPLLAACADLVVAFDERRARRALEAQLAQAERLASVGTLAAGMAHEINNPLAYVLLNLQAFARHTEGVGALLERMAAALPHDPDEAHRLRELLGQIEVRVARVKQNAGDAMEGAERVQRIVRDLMTFSRVSEEQRGFVNVNASLDVAIKLADHEIKYRARLTRDLGELAPVLGNEGRLSQVLLNLLINAARAIEEGHPDENEIRVRTWMVGDEVHVEVADTGGGVQPEHLERLFEPFFSTRAPGTGAGLGLSICHNIVRAHGGRIEVESQLGEGTRFVVRLPAARSAQPSSSGPVRRSDAPPAMRRARILLVDDEPMVIRVLSQLLARTYEVVSADGLGSATKTLEADAGFDAIVCDMMMLDGTGIDLHTWVGAHRPELAPRMVFMTGGTFTPKARAFLTGEAAYNLTKPFSIAELDEILRAVLG